MIKAIILAAGQGTRLKKHFKLPKCLIRLGSKKKTLLELSYINLINSKIKNIHIITGYKSQEIKKILKNKVNYLNFKNYKKSNNLQTLLFAKSLLNNSFICLFADITYERKIISKLLIKNKKICLAIDTSNVLEGTMRVKIKKNKIIEIGSHIPISEGDGNFIGLSKFSKSGAILLKKYLIKQKNNYKDYYTYAINKMIENGVTINYLDIKNKFWKEIDTSSDLAEAKSKFKHIENKISK